MPKKKIRVIELFAGVGGFRLGLQNASNIYDIVWSNQWEPATKTQHASKVYEARFGKDNHSNQDIASVKIEDIPDHDLVVGGFPCQDYSVATTLKNSKGLIGKKGVLWWSIHRILSEKEQKPKYLLLENVDRLLKSPSTQRGRDFAIILKSLNDLGYAVEWRVINAAEYGMPQRRRRVFFLAYHRTSNLYQELNQCEPSKWIASKGVLAKSFNVERVDESIISSFKLSKDLVTLTKDFNIGGKKSPFLNTGIMISGKVSTVKTSFVFHGERTLLGDILQNGEVTDDFFIEKAELEKWKKLKGAKKEVRTTKSGFTYNYSEGAMIFPDPLDNASRTIITGEGGKSPSRFKHVVMSDRGLRRLTPIELERLNMFPDNHTKLDGISDGKRAFFMGNALVVGVVEKIASEFIKRV